MDVRNQKVAGHVSNWLAGALIGAIIGAMIMAMLRDGAVKERDRLAAAYIAVKTYEMRSVICNIGRDDIPERGGMKAACLDGVKLKAKEEAEKIASGKSSYRQ